MYRFTLDRFTLDNVKNDPEMRKAFLQTLNSSLYSSLYEYILFETVWDNSEWFPKMFNTYMDVDGRITMQNPIFANMVLSRMNYHIKKLRNSISNINIDTLHYIVTNHFDKCSYDFLNDMLRHDPNILETFFKLHANNVRFPYAYLEQIIKNGYMDQFLLFKKYMEENNFKIALDHAIFFINNIDILDLVLNENYSIRPKQLLAIAKNFNYNMDIMYRFALHGYLSNNICYKCDKIECSVNIILYYISIILKKENDFLKQFILFDDDFILIKGIILALDIRKEIKENDAYPELVNNVIKYSNDLYIYEKEGCSEFYVSNTLDTKDKNMFKNKEITSLKYVYYQTDEMCLNIISNIPDEFRFVRNRKPLLLQFALINKENTKYLTNNEKKNVRADYIYFKIHNKKNNSSRLDLLQ